MAAILFRSRCVKVYWNELFQCCFNVLVWAGRTKWHFSSLQVVSTHCGPVISYGDTDQGQYWLGAWRQQAINWYNIDFYCVRSGGIHLRAIVQRLPNMIFYMMNLKIMFLRLWPHVPGIHDDVIKWKHFRVTGHLCGEFTGVGVMKWKRFPHYRPFMMGIDWQPVDSPHKWPAMQTFQGVSC